ASLQLRESWELLIASLGMEDPLTTRTMVLLSRTLIALGDLESGMEIGRGALKNLVKLYGQDADQAATAAFFLSSGAYQFGRLGEAEELTLQALQAWEKIYGHVSLQAAACWTHWKHGMSAAKTEGTDFHRRAADIKMQVLGEHETTAASLGHIGMAEAELGNWKEAETLLASSLEQFDRLGVGKNAEGIAAFREKLNECRSMLAKEPTDE
ncbi:MAG: tetratricopeptide repeat protein, partial [Bilophila wadsworthia]